MLGVAERTWSTAGHRGDDQFTVWRQIVADAFVPVDLTRPEQDPTAGFRSLCRQRRVGELSLSWLASSAQGVSRTATQLRLGHSGIYFLNFMLSGTGTAMQDGRTAHAGPGDFVVLDGDRPFELEFDRPFHQLSLAIPKEAYDPLVAAPGTTTAVTVRGCTGLGAVVGGALLGMARDDVVVSARDARHVQDHLIGLVAHALTDPQAVAMGRREILLQQAIEEIELGLADPDLTLTTVAARMHISVSYMGKLFADRGTSFGRWLLARRLDRAWVALDPTAGPITVTEVAMAYGFRDSGHFSRTFRGRFGVTPSDRRLGSAVVIRPEGSVPAPISPAVR